MIRLILAAVKSCKTFLPGLVRGIDVIMLPFCLGGRRVPLRCRSGNHPQTLRFNLAQKWAKQSTIRVSHEKAMKTAFAHMSENNLFTGTKRNMEYINFKKLVTAFFHRVARIKPNLGINEPGPS